MHSKLKKFSFILLFLLATGCENIKSQVENWAKKNSLRAPQNLGGSEAKTKFSSVCPRGSTELRASSDSKKMCKTFAGTIFPAAEAFQEYYSNGNPKTLLVYNGNNLLRANWHENGRQKEEINYLNNKKEGQWKSWYEDGKLKETGKYISGKKSGVFNFYYPAGGVKEKSEYQNDEKNGLSTGYNNQGKVISRETFKGGKRHGNAEYFNEQSGTLSSHGAYSNGNYIGRWINYNQDGTRASVGSFNENGQKDGEWKLYDLKGTPTSTEYYANGEVSKKLVLKADVAFEGGDTLGAKPPELRPKNRFKPQPTTKQEVKGWQPL